MPDHPTSLPFKISIPDSRLKRLRLKLNLTDFPSELGTDTSFPWTRGPPLQSLRNLTDHWIKDYDWRKAEAFLNDSLPQFMTKIDVDCHGEYDIHFVHVRSRAIDAIPLVFLHGWPGSFYEVSKIAHSLADGNGGRDGPFFHVVAPSLVDHGFSSGSRTVSAPSP